MGEALTIEARHERGYPIVTVAGEIDIATATRLRERLSVRAAAHGGSLHVGCARPKVRQLCQRTGLDRRLPPARTLEEAMDALMAARGTPR